MASEAGSTISPSHIWRGCPEPAPGGSVREVPQDRQRIGEHRPVHPATEKNFKPSIF